MKAKQQIEVTLHLTPGAARKFANVREYVKDLIQDSPKEKMLIAAEMDLSQSDLSRKLAENENDCRRFTTEDLETYIETQVDYSPIYYLIEKYLLDDHDDDIRRKIDELRARLRNKVRAKRA